MFLFRMLALLLLLVAVYGGAQASGLLDDTSPEAIRSLVARGGAFSVAAYLLAFTLGQLVYIPGMVFVVSGALAFGGFYGFILAMVGSLLSVSFSFLVARSVGGTPLADPQQSWLKRLVLRLDTNPLSSMILLRLMAGTAPWLNYLLGMSMVTYRNYLLAATLGILLPVLLTVLFADWILQYIG